MARKEKQYHYIYKTTNVINNKYYIGMHSTDNLEDGYLGSGRRLRFSINYYGKDKFIKEILEFLPDRKSLKEREKEIVNSELLNDGLCMNLQVGGGGGFINEEHMMKCSKAGNIAFREKLKNDPEFFKKTSDRNRERLLHLIAEGVVLPIKEINNFTGKKHSEESKRKMSESSKDIGIGETNSQYNTYWITKDGVNKKIKKDDLDFYVEKGWIKGRKYDDELILKIKEINNKRRKVERPPYEILKDEVSNFGYNWCGRKYGVHSTCIKKWLIQYEKY